MHELPVLGSLVIIFSLTLPISYIFHRLKCPAVVGYLLTGVVIGPHALALVKDSQQINWLSEIGVVLLMFTVGMELSLSSLLKNLRTVVGSGLTQFGLNLLFFAGVAFCFDFDINQAIFYGMLLAISSTAIVFKAYSDRGELDTYHGQICAGVLLFQDLMVIPILLVAPFLTGESELQLGTFISVLLKASLGISAIFFVAKLAVPHLIKTFIKLKDREIMLLLIILICMLGAWGAQEMGLTLAMGAFIVGLILSESEYCHDMVSDILPFRDFFSSLFFISIGMMLQLPFLGEHAFALLMGTTAVIFAKGAINTLSVYLLERSWYRSIISGTRLAQVGEFSFLVIGAFVGSQAVPEIVFQTFLSVAILSMLLTPVLIPLSNLLGRRILNINKTQMPDLSGLAPKIKDHVIIAGYGNIGQYLAKILKDTHIPFIVVEKDHETISAASSQGMKAFYGDISRNNILDLCAVSQARAIVYTQGNSNAIKSSSLYARSKNQRLYILVMSGSTQEVVDYLSIGVNRVVSSEFETTVEMFSRILSEFDIPDNVIQNYVEMARVEGYGMFRGVELQPESMKNFYAYLAKTTTITHLLLENSFWIEKNFSELNEQTKQSGAVVISIVRGASYFTSPSNDFTLQANDLLVLVGAHQQLDKAKMILENGSLDCHQN